jgi:hypothetical protein
MRYIKLFEEWLNEEDPLADLMGGGDEEEKKPKEDPLEKQKKEVEKKEKEAKEKEEKKMDNSLEKIDDLLKDKPDVKEKIYDKVKNALEKSDRALIRNTINDVTFLQQDLQTAGDDASVAILSKVKDILDARDKTYTTNKYV